MAAPPNGGTTNSPISNGGSNGSKGVVAGAFDLSNRLVSALPPAFLMLALINAFFIGVVMWFMDSQSKQRSEMAAKLIDRCMDIALHADAPVH